MKVFQILNDICHWDATKQHPTLADTEGKYAPDIVFIEAPDYVFEGWGYLDGELIKPTPPDGWLYDDNTGTFYPEGHSPPRPEEVSDPINDLEILMIDTEYRLTLLELGVK